MSGQIQINCIVNGAQRELHAYPMERLLDVLREQLSLTGTKEGCGEGECGACTVIIAEAARDLRRRAMRHLHTGNDHRGREPLREASESD